MASRTQNGHLKNSEAPKQNPLTSSSSIGPTFTVTGPSVDSIQGTNQLAIARTAELLKSLNALTNQQGTNLRPSIYTFLTNHKLFSLNMLNSYDVESLVLLTEQDLFDPSFPKNIESIIEKRKLQYALTKLKVIEVIKVSEKLFNDIKIIDWTSVSKLTNGKELYFLFVQNYSKWDTSLEQLAARINMNFEIELALKKLEKNIKKLRKVWITINHFIVAHVEQKSPYGDIPIIQEPSRRGTLSASDSNSNSNSNSVPRKTIERHRTYAFISNSASEQERAAYEKYPWFFPGISHGEALELLKDKPTGSFLVRKSEKQKTLTVCYVSEDGVHMAHVLFNEEMNEYWWERTKGGNASAKFNELSDLIGNHMAVLKYPVTHNEFEKELQSWLHSRGFSEVVTAITDMGVTSIHSLIDLTETDFDNSPTFISKPALRRSLWKEIEKLKNTIPQGKTLKNSSSTDSASHLETKFRLQTLSALDISDIMNDTLISLLSGHWMVFAAQFAETRHKVESYRSVAQPSASLLLDLCNADVGIVTFLLNMSRVSAMKAEANRLEKVWSMKLSRDRSGTLSSSDGSWGSTTESNSRPISSTSYIPPVQMFPALGWKAEMPREEVEGLLKGKPPLTFATTWNNTLATYLVSRVTEKHNVEHISLFVVNFDGRSTTVKTTDSVTYNSILDAVRSMKESGKLGQPV